MKSGSREMAVNRLHAVLLFIILRPAQVPLEQAAALRV